MRAKAERMRLGEEIRHGRKKGECLNDSVVTMPNNLTNRFTSLTHIPVYHNPYMGIESLYMLGLG